MKAVSKTMYIPLYGKALVTRRGILLDDPKAREIWAQEGFPLKGKAASKYLAYYMSMRAVVYDRWTETQLREHPEAVVLHIGCGMDSRALRVTEKRQCWYDLDLPDVIRERRRYFRELDNYRMIPADVTDPDWLAGIPTAQKAVVVMEGVCMYFPPETLQRILRQLGEHFGQVALVLDCYSTFAAKASRKRNPINEVGVTEVWGMDDVSAVMKNTGFSLLGERDMTPTTLIAQLSAGERMVFSNLYAGRMARKLYHMYELKKA